MILYWSWFCFADVFYIVLVTVTAWLMRILVQNGTFIFATWMTIASLVTLTVILVYFDSPDFPTGANERG